MKPLRCLLVLIGTFTLSNGATASPQEPDELPTRYVSAPNLPYSSMQEWEGRVAVVRARSGSYGVRDPSTRREILRPNWKAVEIIQARHPSPAVAPPVPADLLATKVRMQLFTLSGEPVDVPPFDRIEVLHDFFVSLRPGLMLWKTTDLQAKTCMLYSMGFRPLLRTPMPLDVFGKCPAEYFKEYSSFAFTDTAEKSRIYRKELAGPEGLLLPTAANIDGTIVFRYEDGSLVLRRRRGGPLEYRLVNAAAQDVQGASFSRFRTFGRRPLVLHEGKWRTLNPDGTLGSRLLFRFSS